MKHIRKIHKISTDQSIENGFEKNTWRTGLSRNSPRTNFSVFFPHGGRRKTGPRPTDAITVLVENIQYWFMLHFLGSDSP